MALNLNNWLPTLEAWREAIQSSPNNPPSFTIPIGEFDNAFQIHARANDLIRALKHDPGFNGGRYAMLLNLCFKKLRKEQGGQYTHIMAFIGLRQRGSSQMLPSAVSRQIVTQTDPSGSRILNAFIGIDSDTENTIHQITDTYHNIIESDNPKTVAFDITLHHDFNAKHEVARELQSHLVKRIPGARFAVNYANGKVTYISEPNDDGSFTYKFEADNPNFSI